MSGLVYIEMTVAELKLKPVGTIFIVRPDLQEPAIKFVSVRSGMMELVTYEILTFEAAINIGPLAELEGMSLVIRRMKR